ncbi:hypothetical protein SAMN05428948_1897 [Massilia sp. CF038]|nr:hypothetical protein SAMN05428948_1897 [Massilia sp. CF038]
MHGCCCSQSEEGQAARSGRGTKSGMKEWMGASGWTGGALVCASKGAAWVAGKQAEPACWQKSQLTQQSSLAASGTAAVWPDSNAVSSCCEVLARPGMQQPSTAARVACSGRMNMSRMASKRRNSMVAIITLARPSCRDTGKSAIRPLRAAVRCTSSSRRRGPIANTKHHIACVLWGWGMPQHLREDDRLRLPLIDASWASPWGRGLSVYG